MYGCLFIVIKCKYSPGIYKKTLTTKTDMQLKSVDHLVDELLKSPHFPEKEKVIKALIPLKTKLLTAKQEVKYINLFKDNETKQSHVINTLYLREENTREIVKNISSNVLQNNKYLKQKVQEYELEHICKPTDVLMDPFSQGGRELNDKFSKEHIQCIKFTNIFLNIKNLNYVLKNRINDISEYQKQSIIEEANQKLKKINTMYVLWKPEFQKLIKLIHSVFNLPTEKVTQYLSNHEFDSAVPYTEALKEHKTVREKDIYNTKYLVNQLKLNCHIKDWHPQFLTLRKPQSLIQQPPEVALTFCKYNKTEYTSELFKHIKKANAHIPKILYKKFKTNIKNAI